MRDTRAVVLATAVVVVVAGVVVLLNRSSTPAPPPDAGGYRRAHAGVCEAATMVGAGDAAGAHGVFLARSHTALHSLASAAAEVDRSVAARLLEAKAAVEASLPSAAPGAASDLRRLADATANAMRTVTGQRPAACEGDGKDS